MEDFKIFYNILTKPIYSSYKEAWMLVKHQPYIVQIPITTYKTYASLDTIGKFEDTLYFESKKSKSYKRSSS